MCISQFHQKVQGIGHLFNKHRVISLKIAQEQSWMQITNKLINNKNVMNNIFNVVGDVELLVFSDFV